MNGRPIGKSDVFVVTVADEKQPDADVIVPDAEKPASAGKFIE